MTATDELRRLLDERGVEWRAGEIMTFTDGADYLPTETDRLNVTLFNLTPEQAVEATLGRGTCRLVKEHFGRSGKNYRMVCSECHHIIYDGWQEKPRYCPFCGRKVDA